MKELAGPLLELPGMGVDSAGEFLVAAGDNPERLGSEASFSDDVWSLSHPRILGENQPSPTQPRRQPSAKLCSAHRSSISHPNGRTNLGLHDPSFGGGPFQTRSDEVFEALCCKGGVSRIAWLEGSLLGFAPRAQLILKRLTLLT